MSSSGAWHTETTEYLRHFSVRDCLQQALWRDVSAPLPGWAYLWADWQEFPVRVVFPTRRDRRWGELLTARRWGGTLWPSSVLCWLQFQIQGHRALSSSPYRPVNYYISAAHSQRGLCSSWEMGV